MTVQVLKVIVKILFRYRNERTCVLYEGTWVLRVVVGIYARASDSDAASLPLLWSW